MAFDLIARLKMIDDLTGPMRRVTQSLDRMKSSTQQLEQSNTRNNRATEQSRNANERLDKTVGNLRRSTDLFRDAQGRLRNVLGQYASDTDKASEANKRFNFTLGNIIKGYVTVRSLSAMGHGLSGAFNTAADFQAEMSRMRGLTDDATGNDAQSIANLQKIRSLALEIGGTTQVGPVEAVKGMQILAQAGLQTKDILNSIPSLVSAKIVSGEEFDTVAKVGMTAMTAFELSSTKMGHIADVIAKAAKDSAADITDFGYTLKYVAPQANAAGQSLESVAAAMAILSNVQIKGEMAGTSLRSIYENLATKKGDIESALKIKLTNPKTGNFLSFAEIIGKLHTRYASFTNNFTTNNQAMAQSINKAFGTTAGPAITRLVKMSQEEFMKYQKSLENSSGTSAKLAAIMADNTKSASERMRGAMEVMQISALTPFLPAIQKVFTSAAVWMNNYSPVLEKAMTKFVDNAGVYIKKNFTDNDKFIDAKGFWNKAVFVMEQLNSDFNAWLDNGGREKIKLVGTRVGDALSEGLAGAAKLLTPSAILLGNAIVNGMVQGLKGAMADNPMFSMLVGGLVGAKVGGAWGALFGGLAGLMGSAVLQGKTPETKESKAWEKATTNTFNYQGNWSSSANSGDSYIPKKASGMSYVPYDGYVASLHQGETILPKGEAQAYRQGGKGNNFTFGDIHIHGGSNTKADAQALMSEMAKLIAQAGGAMA